MHLIASISLVMLSIIFHGHRLRQIKWKNDVRIPSRSGKKNSIKTWKQIISLFDNSSFFMRNKLFDSPLGEKYLNSRSHSPNVLMIRCLWTFFLFHVLYNKFQQHQVKLQKRLYGWLELFIPMESHWLPTTSAKSVHSQHQVVF
jgi:hypothetical protein